MINVVDFEDAVAAFREVAKDIKINKQNSAPQWFNTREAARYLRISIPTLARWRRDGVIPYKKPGTGNKVLYRKADLDDALARM